MAAAEQLASFTSGPRLHHDRQGTVEQATVGGLIQEWFSRSSYNLCLQPLLLDSSLFHIIPHCSDDCPGVVPYSFASPGDGP